MRQMAIWMGLAALVGCSATRPSSGVVGNRIAGATDLGPIPRDTIFEFVIGVQLTQPPGRLQKLILQQAYTHDYFLPADFADAFGATRADYQRLINWLHAQGFTIVRTTAGRTTVTVRGTAEQIERAFSVGVHEFEDKDGRFTAVDRELQLTPWLAQMFAGAVGLSGTHGWGTHLARPPAPQPNAANAAQLAQMYNAANINNPGKGETVAILGAGTPPDPVNDVGKYLSTFQPHNVTKLAAGQYTVQLVGGPNRDPQNLASEEYGENVLDIDMVLAMAPYANVVHVMTATNTPGLFTDGISYIVNEQHAAHSVSVSYGTCERGAASEMPVVEILLQQAKAQGQQWFFAAGDSGSDGCRDGSGNPIYSAGWPASSPSAIGVGGTQLNGTTEEVWYQGGFPPLFPSSSGGGGASESFDKPSYQAGVGPGANDGARDEPDVAALAGSPGVSIVQGGKTNAAEGTSAAAPIWAGVWALIDQGRGGAGITTAHESLYALGKAGTGFHDITTGTLGGPSGNADGYAAKPGYDLATGWGTPDVASLIANWR
jgi:kumamolisin